jgi:hypothetical protein
MLSRDTGHSRVPAPPHIKTGMTAKLISVFRFAGAPPSFESDFNGLGGEAVAASAAPCKVSAQALHFMG